jgi:hypothetical protein
VIRLLGVLGILLAAAGLLSVATVGRPMLFAPRLLPVPLLISTLTDIVLNVLLLSGAIALLARRPWGRTLLLAYAWCAVLLLACNVLIAGAETAVRLSFARSALLMFRNYTYLLSMVGYSANRLTYPLIVLIFLKTPAARAAFTTDPGRGFDPQIAPSGERP